MIEHEALLQTLVEEHPHPLLFATVSGAHLYGFPSPDSDVDLRGAHIKGPCELLSLNPADDTLEQDGIRDGVELDLVSHDIAKFFLMMLKKNGYVLEQLYSPLVVHAMPEFEELRAIGRDCVTKFHMHHYAGFAQNQWTLLQKESPPRVKPLLYTYRVVLTGIHLMRTGEIESNLPALNADARLPFIDELIARKLAGAEKSVLDDADLAFHAAEFERLLGVLEEASEASSLPAAPTARPALNDLLLRLRKQSLASWTA